MLMVISFLFFSVLLNSNVKFSIMFFKRRPWLWIFLNFKQIKIPPSGLYHGYGLSLICKHQYI